MENNEALDLIGGLSAPSKMPWYSWSISAELCITGSKLAEVEGSTCYGCYALKGNYRLANVKKAQERRLNGLKDTRFVEAFVIVLTNLYNKTRAKRTLPDGSVIKENRFRWHDAGDLQDIEHLQKIVDIAIKTPFLNHWLPTREYGIVNQWMERKPQGFPSNLTVRMSAVMVGDDMSKTPMGLPYSTVGVDYSTTLFQCSAPKQQGQCKDCSACWIKELNVNYKKH